ARTAERLAQAEHVHVVVVDALMGRIGIVAHPGPDAFDLASGHADADPAAADDDAALGPAVPDRVADPAREDRVVGRRPIGRAEIDRLVAGRTPLLEPLRLHIDAPSVPG